MNNLLRKMTEASIVQLRDDVIEWGAVATVSSRDELSEIIGAKRAERLKSWVSNYGSVLPNVKRSPTKAAKRPSSGATHLVVGDCHAAPGQSMERFEWLGRMIAKLQPDTVIQVGDWYSMDSLCQHRTLKDRAEELVMDDILAGQQALATLEHAMRGWSGRKVLTLGNHDVRADNISGSAPWMDGVLDIGKSHRDAGWEVVDFLQPCRIDGVLYQHYLTVKGTARPISGKFHSLRLLERVKFAESVVVGHAHVLQHRMESRPGKRVHSLVAGCYFDHTESYAGEDNHEWWRGVIVLRGVRDGDFDMETWSIDRIRSEFGR